MYGYRRGRRFRRRGNRLYRVYGHGVPVMPLYSMPKLPITPKNPIRYTDSMVSNIPIKSAEKVNKIYALLPKLNCRACGYPSCHDCALAIARGAAPPDACRVIGTRIKEKVEEILREN
ncbi:MAG: (Fe-S)-binding protein [Candidatus Njordarchaeia archaeon]